MRHYRIIQGGPVHTPRFRETMPASRARLGGAVAITPQGPGAGESSPWWSWFQNFNPLSPGAQGESQLAAMTGMPDSNPFMPKISINPVSGDLNVTSPTGPSTGSAIGARLSSSPFGGELANYLGLNKGPGGGNTLGAGQHWQAIKAKGSGTELVAGGGPIRAILKLLHDYGEYADVGLTALLVGEDEGPREAFKAASDVYLVLKTVDMMTGNKTVDIPGLSKHKHKGSGGGSGTKYAVGGGYGGRPRGYYPVAGDYGGGKAHLSADQTRRLATALNVIIHHLATTIGSSAGSSGGARPTTAAERVFLHGMTFPKEMVAYPIR